MIITLARKPLAVANVSENTKQYGTGSLNIDGSRFGLTGGRWPANLVLAHKPGCKRCGTIQIKGITGGGGQKKYGSQNRGNENTTHYDKLGYVDANGMETVEAWDCVDGCPVLSPEEARFFKQLAGGTDDHNPRP